MDITSPLEENGRGSNSLSPKQSSEHQNHDLRFQDMESASTEYRPVGSEAKTPNCPSEDVGSIRSNFGRADMQNTSPKNFRRLSHSGKKVATKLRSRYLLRSLDGVRVLRSMSKGPGKTPPQSGNNPINHVKEKGKRRRKKERASNDVFLRYRKRVRYLLTRMNYEKSLIDAYSGEGWKGQSSEKIKPEKELQRAKSEIIRCKLNMRDVFQHLDSSISEGRFDDSLFDSEGEICSEDIFCANCRSKEMSADNDIILCDGICDRGFHQKCLNPPLLNENIPTGDEGWLCPGCDCKVDCIDLLNEFQGTGLSIEDKWEKVFPEAAAFATGDKQYDDCGLPSDDSEDNDYNPDGVEVEEELEKGSSSEEDSKASNHDVLDENFGFPSDDSGDIDYDPNNPALDEKVQKGYSTSDESDFSSDTDDLDAPSNDFSVNETQVSPTSKYSEPGKRSDGRVRNKSSVNYELHSLMESDLSQENPVPVSSKRQRERLDYKMLHDETYGNVSSDSSDDEDWTEMGTPKKVKNDAVGEDTAGLTTGNGQTVENRRSSKSIKGEPPGAKTIQSRITDHVIAEVKDNSLERKIHGKFQSGGLNHAIAKAAKENKDFPEPDSNGNKAGSSSQRSFSKAVSQKLRDYFEENQYPSRDTKESLAKELGITAHQVSKWFDNARHSFRVSAKEVSPAGTKSDNATIVRENSKNIIKSGSTMGSERSASKGQVKPPGKSLNIEASGTKHAFGDRDKKKEVIGENISRQSLVMRELRKLRKGK